MGALWIPDAADWLRAAGLDVVEYPGWLTRSRSSGGFDDILAIGMHHAASSPRRTDQAAADAHWKYHQYRPVGNFTLGRSGAWWVGAAGATNTQGKGGPLPLSRGTIPLDQGNRYTIAIEAENNGVGEPWSPDMQTAYTLGIAALIIGLADEGAYDAATRRHRPIRLSAASDVIAHFEWTGRKIDPAGPSQWVDNGDRYLRWRMPAVRSSIAADVDSLTTPPPPPPPPAVPVTEVPDMFTWSPKGYANAFLIGAGPAIALSGPAFQLLSKPVDEGGRGLPHIAGDDHEWMLESVLHQSGLTRNALVKLSG